MDGDHQKRCLSHCLATAPHQLHNIFCVYTARRRKYCAGVAVLEIKVLGGDGEVSLHHDLDRANDLF